MSKDKSKVCVDLVINGASATPAPPIGSALGPRGINLQAFCKQFNDYTKDWKGIPVRVSVIISQDKSFVNVYKGFPSTYCIKKVAGLDSGSKTPGREVKKTINMAQVDEIISMMEGGSFNSTEQKSKRAIIIGTARSMGINVNLN